MKICLLTDTHLVEKHSVFNDNIEIVYDFIRADGFDAVIQLGDVTADGVTYPDQMDFAAATHAALTTPIRYIPGNHDIGDNPGVPGQALEKPLDLARLADFRHIFGPDYWSFETEDWQLLGLNSQLFGTGTEAEEAQFAWLAQTLDESEGALGVFSHKPLMPHDDPATPPVRYIAEAPRQRLFEMLFRRELKFVASGHVHQRRRFVLDGVEHVWVPSASFCVPDALQSRVGEKVVGIMELELTGDGAYCFAAPVLEGLVRHNLLDREEIYPGVVALRERLGAAAAL